MIEMIYNIVCDNCGKKKEYKKQNHEQFIIDFCKDGWHIQMNKKDKKANHFCCKECLNIYEN